MDGKYNRNACSRPQQQTWETITEESAVDSLSQSLPGPSSATPGGPEFSEEISLRLSLTPDSNGELPGPSSAVVSTMSETQPTLGHRAAFMSLKKDGEDLLNL